MAPNWKIQAESKAQSSASDRKGQTQAIEPDVCRMVCVIQRKQIRGIESSSSLSITDHLQGGGVAETLLTHSIRSYCKRFHGLGRMEPAQCHHSSAFDQGTAPHRQNSEGHNVRVLVLSDASVASPARESECSDCTNSKFVRYVEYVVSR